MTEIEMIRRLLVIEKEVIAHREKIIELQNNKQTPIELEMIVYFENAINEINYHRNKIDNNFWHYGDAKIVRNAIHKYENFINYLKGDKS